MSVFRVEKTNNFTIMSNYHFKDKRLSLKAKGLLSTMLSLPESWDYTLVGLTKICREGVTSIRSAVAELEEFGYLERERIRNASGQYEDIEYIIHEQPKSDEPLFDEPAPEKPPSENPTKASPTSAKRTQLNIKNTNNQKDKEKRKLKTNVINNSSINQGEAKSNESAEKAAGIDKIDLLQTEEKIKENIDYECLCQRYGQERTNEIVELMLGIMYSSKSTINISGSDYPAEYIKSRIMKLDFHNIEYVFDNMNKTTTKIANIHGYLKAALFNALATTDSYYRAEVNHDMEDFWERAVKLNQ